MTNNKKKGKTHKYVAITPLAYKSLKQMIDREPKEDGSFKTLCEMASSVIVRAANQ